MTPMLRRATAALLTAHAVAHLIGYTWPWWVLEPLPSPPDDAAWAGDTVMRAASVGWLATAIGFLIAALALLWQHHAWRRILAVVAVASLVLSVVCWPGSLLGVPINLTMLAVLGWTARPVQALAWRED